MAKPTAREPQRIAKLLARAGVASRREIERMIAEGRVALDGVALQTPATVLPSLRGITVDGEAVEAAAPARLYVFHKPAGLLTTATDPRGRPTIYDALPDSLPRVMPVGRLDLATEGLLLLTTDGELKRQLELPSTGVERVYRARAYGNITQEQLEALIEGVEIEGVRYGSIDANLERRTGANVWIELTLTEGKNREVRRVLEYLGLRVSRLIRTRYGPLVLGDMPEGSVGEVRQVDLIAFRQALAKGRPTDGLMMAVPIDGAEKLKRVRTAPKPHSGEGRGPAAAKPEVRQPVARPERTRQPRAATEPQPGPGLRRGGKSSEAGEATRPTRSPRPPQRKAGWARPKPKTGPGKK